MQSSGQGVITTDHTLSQATDGGANLLICGSASGVTITFPTSGGTFWLNNRCQYDVTLSYPKGSDFGTVLHPRQQVALSGDGNGFWRITATGNPLHTVFAYVTCTSSGCTINGESGVSSVVRNAIGNYTVNFTAPFADANYAAVATTTGNNGAGEATIYQPTKSVGSVQVLNWGSGSGTFASDGFFSLIVIGF